MISPGLREALHKVRVRAGSFLSVAVLVLARPTPESLVLGFLVAGVGLLIRAWASGHLQKEKTLAVSGPYRYSRNPLYFGNFFIGAGIAAAALSWWVLGLFAAYFGFFYPLIIARERDRMKQLFPGEYDDYGRQVPLFLPSFLRRHGGVPRRFSRELYLRNKEYRALIGAVVFWLLLAAKALLLNR